MSVQVSYKKQTLFGIFLILVLFFMLEGISQILWYDIQNNCNINETYFENLKQEYSEKLCFDYTNLEYSEENIRRNVPNQNLNTLNINSLGFRGDEIDLEKWSKEYKIMVVGGSTTFGLGSTSDKTTMPFLLEKKIKNELDLDVTVINAGIIAASSREEVFYIVNDLADMKPDLVLVFDGYNDSFNIKLSEVDTNNEYAGEIEKNNLELFVKKYFKFLALPNVIYQHTHDYVQIYNLNDEMKRENSEKWVSRWNKVCDIAEEKDFKLIVTIQPILGTSDREINHIEKKIFESPKHQKTLQMLNGLVNSMGDLKCDSIDLTNTFDGVDTQIYFSSVHTGDFGNKIIADKIYEKILPTILLDNSNGIE